MTEEYKRYVLEDDGEPDVEFVGKGIAAVDDMVRNGQERDRYHVVRVYETRGGRYVVSARHISRWQGEGETSTVHEYDTLVDLAADLRDEEVIPLAIELGRELAEGYPDFRKTWVRKIE